MEARLSLLEQILAQQFEDSQLKVIRDRVLIVEARKVTLDPEGILRIEGCIYVPRVGKLLGLILPIVLDI